MAWFVDKFRLCFRRFFVEPGTFAETGGRFSGVVERESSFRTGGPLKFGARPQFEENIGRYLEKAASYGAVMITPRSYLCISGACISTDDDSGRSLLTDSDHIRPSEILTSRFDFLDTLLKWGHEAGTRQLDSGEKAKSAASN
jgi:hypothetical protein